VLVRRQFFAVGVNAEGYREILGIDVTTAEDGAGWLTFLRSLTARGLSGVRLVTSDAHAGLLAAIGVTVPGASWQRCRTHYPTNLMGATPTRNPLRRKMIGPSMRCQTSCRRSQTILNAAGPTLGHSGAVEAISLWGIDRRPVADISTPHRW
jgi:Transposase, Mutator family